MRIELRKLTSTDVLAGAGAGARTLARLIDTVAAAPCPEPVFLDFTGIDVATGSFLRESVLSFRNYCRLSQPGLYPVVANATDAVREELEFILRAMGDVVVTCNLDAHGNPSDAKVIGTLEPKQRTTLLAVIKAGETDAAGLQKEVGEQEPIRGTAWNNRLSSLVAKGILIEVRRDRAKRYRPVLEGLSYGS